MRPPTSVSMRPGTGGSVYTSTKPNNALQPSSCHVSRAAGSGVGAVAAAAVCAQSTSAVAAASGPTQLSSQDPALDSLIDRWLSHKHASTSAPEQYSGANGSGGSSSSRRQQRGAQEVSVAQEWEALLGPVTVTMASLATLEDGDELFALTDSLGHLGGSLQELQQLASQLLVQQQQQQQQQQQDDGATRSAPSAAEAQQYRQQLAQLLLTAAEQAAALDDSGLINLLAISTVILTAIKHSGGSSSSSSSNSSSTSSGSSSTEAAPVHAAATAAVQAACAELWLRPRVASCLGASALTSLTVVLRRLSRLGVSGSALPASLPLSAYRQLQQLAEVGELSASQLAVCCWCLSSLPGAPPAAAVAVALRTAAALAASTTTSSSSTSSRQRSRGDSTAASGFDGLAVRRLMAACVNWQPYLAGQLKGDSRAASAVAAAAAEWIQSAAGVFLQLNSTGSPAGSSSSSSSTDGVWKVAASVAQAAAAYGICPGEDFVLAAAAKLQQEQAAAVRSAPGPGAGEGDAPAAAAAAAREAQDVAAAAGYLVPWWSCLPGELQPLQAVLQLHSWWQQQQGQEQPSLLHTFLTAVEHSCSSAVGQQQQVHEQLDLLAQQLLTNSSGDAAAVRNVALSPLLRAMTASSCRSQQLPLCVAAAEALQANAQGAASSSGTAAGVDAAAALCKIKPPGWQQLLQQLVQALIRSDSSILQQLPLGAAMQLHAAAAAVAGESPAAAELAAALLQQLLQRSALVGATAHEAAELLVLLTVGRAPWHITSGQQLAPAPPAGLAVTSSSDGTSSSSSSDGSGNGSPPAVVLLQQQSLRCLGVIVKDGGRSLLPVQLVPLLAALCYLQQTQEQQQVTQQQGQQWFGVMQGQVLSAYQHLHRESLAAVSLQLQDAASLLAPRDVAWSVRLLALLQARPNLTLSAVVEAAGQCAVRMRQQDLVWMLWGLIKLQFTGKRRLQELLLSTALQAAVVTDSSPQAGSLYSEGAAAGQEGAAGVAYGEAAATGVPATGSSSSRDATLLDSDVALLWVAASRSCRDAAVVQLLAQVTQQGLLGPLSTPSTAFRPAQVASVVWSFTRMSRLQLPHQQQLMQQRPLVLQLAEASLSSSAAAQELTGRQTAVLAWGLHRLGDTPSSTAAAALAAALLQHAQPTSPASIHSRIAGVLPGEFSCILYCLASWGVSLQQQELQQLEVYLQQQLHADLQAAAAAAAAKAAGAEAGSSDTSSSSGLRWDGPAVCSACSSLTQLGASLQHTTLAAAEQYLLKLLPDTPSTAAQLAAASTTLARQQHQRRLKQWRRQLPPPSASDFVLFGTACRDAGYQPWQLLQQFRGWVLLELASKGPAGLLALRSRTPRRHAGFSHSGTGSSTVTSAQATTAPAGAKGRWHRQHQQHQHQQHQQHAHILVSILLFLRQVGYADPALLQQLEALSVDTPVVQQLNGRQLVLLLSSFCQLGYVPEAWFSRGGVRCIKDHVLGTQRSAGSSSSSSSGSSDSKAGSIGGRSGSNGGGSMSGQDCVELLECLAAWHMHPKLRQNTLLHECILPGCMHLLLGTQPQPRVKPQPPRAPGDTASSTGNASSSNRSNGSTAGAGSTVAAAVPEPGSSKASTGAAGANLVASLTGNQVVSLLCSTVELGLPRSNRLFQQLQQQLLRRLQQVWAEFGPAGQVAAAHAAGGSMYDLSGLLKVQELLPQQQQQQQEGVDSIHAWHFSTVSAACRLLWVFGNVGRHPGPQLLGAALSRVVAVATEAADAGLPLPLREITTALYAVTVLQELQHPGAVALAQLLQQAAADGELMSHPQFLQNSEHLAGCLLAAQDAAQAGVGAPPPAPIASFHDADQASAAAADAAAAAAMDGGSQGANSTTQSAPSNVAAAAAAAARSSPWLALPVDVQQRLQEAWRRKVLRKAGKKQGMGEHMQLLLSLRQLGLRGKAKALTDDGVVCIDVAVTTANGERLAVELLGPHNAALNTQRPLGPARLKWRMLANRGYKVVVVNMWQWRQLDSGGLGRGSRDGGSSGGSSVSGAESSIEEYGMVMSEKLLYLQARLQAALGPAGPAALSAAGRVARPLPQEIPARGMGQQQGLPSVVGAERRLFSGGQQDAGSEV